MVNSQIRSQGRVLRLMAAAAVALTLGVAGCSAPGADCAAAPAPSSVTVLWLQADYSDLGNAAYELCVEGNCSTQAPTAQTITKMSVDIPSDSGPGKVQVHLRITPAGEKTASVDESARIALKERDKVCGQPGGYGARLALTPEGGLTGSIPTGGDWNWRGGSQQSTATARN